MTDESITTLSFTYTEAFTLSELRRVAERDPDSYVASFTKERILACREALAKWEAEQAVKKRYKAVLKVGPVRWEVWDQVMNSLTAVFYGNSETEAYAYVQRLNKSEPIDPATLKPGTVIRINGWDYKLQRKAEASPRWYCDGGGEWFFNELEAAFASGKANIVSVPDE